MQVPNEPTRKQLSRAERDARQRRRINLAVGGVLALVVVIIVGGFLYENISSQVRLSQPVANVNGELISTTDFQSRVRLVRAQLQSAGQLLRQQLSDTQTAQQIQSQLDDPVTLGGQVINGMVDECAAEAGRRQFQRRAFRPMKSKRKIEENFGYHRNPPTPAPTRTPLPTPTASAAGDADGYAAADAAAHGHAHQQGKRPAVVSGLSERHRRDGCRAIASTWK